MLNVLLALLVFGGGFALFLYIINKGSTKVKEKLGSKDMTTGLVDKSVSHSNGIVSLLVIIGFFILFLFFLTLIGVIH